MTIEQTQKALEVFTRDRLDLYLGGIPEHMREGVVEYVMCGRPPTDDFMRAIMSNESVIRVMRLADDLNAAKMGEWTSLLSRGVPFDAWGSKYRVKTWIAKGGVIGKPQV